jgi:hypothetical protein
MSQAGNGKLPYAFWSRLQKQFLKLISIFTVVRKYFDLKELSIKTEKKSGAFSTLTESTDQKSSALRKNTVSRDTVPLIKHAIKSGRLCSSLPHVWHVMYVRYVFVLVLKMDVYVNILVAHVWPICTVGTHLCWYSTWKFVGRTWRMCGSYHALVFIMEVCSLMIDIYF